MDEERDERRKWRLLPPILAWALGVPFLAQALGSSSAWIETRNV